MSVYWGMPRVVNILGQKVRISLGKGKSDEVFQEAHLGEWVHAHEGADDEYRVGTFSMRFGRIGIDSRQSDDQLADTFLHENLHAMLRLVQADDEDLVFRLTPVLLDWLRRNPKAVQYLTQKRLVNW